MSIVTKTGDKGETSLFDGSRVPKSDERIAALGELDELNAQLGMLCSQVSSGHRDLLLKLQNQLFELGALLANPKATGSMAAALQELETETERLESALPMLQNFILPGGHSLAAQAHLARAICRRAERSVARIEVLPAAGLPFLNRLSDTLFLLARTFNIENKTEEILWKKS